MSYNAVISPTENYALIAHAPTLVKKKSVKSHTLYVVTLFSYEKLSGSVRLKKIKKKLWAREIDAYQKHWPLGFLGPTFALVGRDIAKRRLQQLGIPHLEKGNLIGLCPNARSMASGFSA